MAKLVVLGTSSAVPGKGHENTHLVLVGDDSSVLVDSVGNTLLRLEMAGVGQDSLNDIILTHCHPDHISGVPSLLMSLWLNGRKNPINIHGLHHTLDCVEKMMELYEWHEWPDFYPVTFHRLSALEMTPVLENSDFRIVASPVSHIIPTIGLRIESLSGGKVVAYSCDTEPCDQVVQLGTDADILLHEATGQSFGHSSSAQAGEIAEKAGAKSLYLIHYPPHLSGSKELLDQARDKFSGDVHYTRDFLEIEF
jgi:ribonuclease Z